MARRPQLARMALGACATSMAAGCTFLIDFTELPAAIDSGLDSAVHVDLRDAHVDARDAPDDAPLRVDASAVDARPSGDAIANLDACTGHKDGKYCGGHQIVWPPSTSDLVVCKSAQVALVRRCMNGAGCVGMLAGYPDECDECSTKIDGTYCGRDFPGWDPANQHQRIRCQGGRLVGSVLCNVCKSVGANSYCQ